jgi:predicted phosphodiesterase
MIIDCISDLHGYYPQLEGGDLLIVAGDCIADNKIAHWAEFFGWFKKQNYRKKVLVAGNHDNFLFQGMVKTKEQAEFCAELRDIENDEPIDYDYLCDSGIEFEYFRCLDDFAHDGHTLERKKLKIWGSPWTLRFPGENPKALAFTCPHENDLAEKWALIPEDTDILVTHSPPLGILDKTIDGYNVGSRTLMGSLVYCFRPKLWVFGHIHESYGQMKYKDQTICVNASYVNERYQPVNKPVRIELL